MIARVVRVLLPPNTRSFFHYPRFTVITHLPGRHRTLFTENRRVAPHAAPNTISNSDEAVILRIGVLLYILSLHEFLYLIVNCDVRSTDEEKRGVVCR